MMAHYSNKIYIVPETKKPRLWIRIESRFNYFVDPDLDFESGSRGKE
jgi:hypothetical protein